MPKVAKLRVSPLSLIHLVKAWCVGLLPASESRSQRCRKGDRLLLLSHPQVKLVPSPTCGSLPILERLSMDNQQGKPDS